MLSSDSESDRSWAETDTPKKKKKTANPKPKNATAPKAGAGEPSLSGIRKSARLGPKAAQPSRPKSYNPLRADSLFTEDNMPQKGQKRQKGGPGGVSKNKKSSLLGYFKPATEEQRWLTRRTETKPQSSPVGGVEDDDLIEDDYDFYNDVYIQRGRSSVKTAAGPDSEYWPNSANLKRTARPSRAFILPKEDLPKDDDGKNEDVRPWAQLYGPSHVDELAVHKKKVADVGTWIGDVFAGKSRRVRARPLSSCICLRTDVK